MKLDTSQLIPEYSAVCSYCKHNTGKRRCVAFGNTPIPLVIWLGQNPHTAPVEGDRGIVFERAAVGGQEGNENA